MIPSFSVDRLRSELARNLPQPEDVFRCFVDLNQFQPQEVNIMIVNDIIEIHGKHDELVDEHGGVRREFRRRCPFPGVFDRTTARAIWSPNGILTITALRKIPQQLAAEGRLIPVMIHTPLYIDTGPRPQANTLLQIADRPSNSN